MQTTRWYKTGNGNTDEISLDLPFTCCYVDSSDFHPSGFKIGLYILLMFGLVIV